MKALLIVPCFNEELRLPVDQFADFLSKHPEISFLFVNDGSKDNTGEILKKLSESYRNADVIDLEKNIGKAEAIRQGVLWAQKKPARFIGFIDADLATPLEELLSMLGIATQDTLYISGCRLARLGSKIKRKPLRHIIGRIFATFASFYLNLPVYDTQCGAKLYDKETAGKIFQKPFATRWLFDVEILRRMILIYGRNRIIKDSVEYPLHSWIDKSDSKIRYIAVVKDLIHLLLSRN